MKRFLTLTLVCLLIFGGSVAAFAEDRSSAPTQETERYKLYLVPGTYAANGNKVENTIASGAKKLSQTECNEIFTDNAYLCEMSEGTNLPVPASARVDKDGTPYAFNGWWSIVNSSVVYFDKVPAITQTTFLYADWRADLSQRKDPVAPDENPQIKALHYMTIKRAATGNTKTVVLRVSGTDMSTAEQLGYGSPVQLYNEWFELSKGDVITVYSKGLGGSETPKVTPIYINDDRAIVLETSGDGSNVTADYLSADKGSSRRNPTLTCVAQTGSHYRIYIKYYFGGSTMAVYLEPMD